MSTDTTPQDFATRARDALAFFDAAEATYSAAMDVEGETGESPDPKVMWAHDDALADAAHMFASLLRPLLDETKALAAALAAEDDGYRLTGIEEAAARLVAVTGTPPAPPALDRVPLLESFTLRFLADDDTTLGMFCDVCGEHVCDAEHDDGLGLLARTALGHTEECDPEDEDGFDKAFDCARCDAEVNADGRDETGSHRCFNPAPGSNRHVHPDDA